jgi:PAS domain S-box-containing protein
MMDHSPEDLPKHDHLRPSRQCKMTGRFFFILAIILAAIMSGPSLVVPKPSAAASVLLLNSYHKGLAWTDKVTLGVETVLSDQDIFVEYMDTKRHSDDLYLTLLRNLFYNKYQATRPDVVISSDDHALSFLLDNRDFLFPGTPIVFCGVNDYSDQLLAGQEKITGVVEAFDIRQTVEMALGLHPSADKMIIVNDTTKTGKANKRVILRLLPDFSERVEFEFLEALSMPALLDRIEKLPSQNLVLLMSFNRDASGQGFNYDTSIGLIAEKCRVPIYGVWDFYLGQGIVGGKLTSGKAQGETAAAIARKIIQGKPADKIPVVTQSPNRWMFDYHQLRRFNIDESRLPPGSEIINRPQSIYGKYKAVIWSMLVTLAALTLLSLFLMTNIQQRKKAENDLLVSQQFIMGITGNVPGVVYQFYATPDGHFGLRYVSEKAVTIFGLDPNPATFFDDFYRSIPPEARQAFLDSINAAVEHFTPWHYEGRFVRPDSDSTIWFSGDSVPHRDGDTIVFDGVLMDITRAKATEEKLRRSERQMSQIVNFLPDPMYVIDQNGRVIVWNQAMEELSGITADAMLGKGDYVYAIPFYGERRPVMIDLVGHWNQVIADTYRDVKRQGDRLFSETMLPLRILGGRYFKNTAGPLYDENGAIVGAIEIIHDITERRTAENALRALHATTQKNLEFIKALLSAIPTPVFYKDVEGRYQGCNRAFSEMMGVTEDALRGKTVQELWPGDKADVYHQKDLELMHNPSRQEYEFRVVDKSGCERDVIFAKDVFRDDKGNLAGIVGAFTDISAIRAAEVKMQLMEHVVQNSPVVLFRWRAETGWPVVFVSDKVSQFGYAPEDLLSGKIPFAALVHPDDLERVTREVMIHSQQGDLDFTQEYRIRTPQGEVRWIDDRTVVERDAQGQITHYQGIVLDITDRKKAEDESKRNERMLRQIMDIVPSMIFVKNDQGRFLMANQAVAESYGMGVEDLVGRLQADLHPNREQVERYLADDRRAIQSGQPLFVQEEPYQDHNGATRWLDVIKVPCDIEDFGEPAIVGLATDITERRETEARLQESEKRYRTMFENTGTGTVLSEADMTLRMVNREFAQMVGYARGEIEGKMNWTDVVAPEDVELLKADHFARREDPFNTPTQYECRLIDRTGRIKPMLLKVRRIPGTQTSIGSFLDISDRKQTEEALLAANRILRLVLDTIPVRVFWKDTACRYLGCNQPFAEDAGFSDPEELISRDDYAFAWCNQAPSYRRDDRAVMATGQPRLNFEEKQTTPDGKTLWLQTSKVPMRDGKDNIIGMLGCYQDVTERKRAHEELQRLRNYLSNIINSMPSVLIGVDTEMRVTQWNQQAEQYTGLSFEKARSQLLATAFPLLVGEMDRIRSAIRDRQVLRNPKIPRQEQGNTRFEDITIFPLAANGMAGAVIRLDDVTEQVRMEEMMIQNEKMLSVGGLAAGMAHEINNPLAGILQNTAVLENRLFGDLPANHKAAEEAGISLTALRQYLELRNLPTMLENIRASGNRAAAIVRNMLSFVRKSDRVVSSHDLRTLLDQTIELAQTDYDMKKHYDFKQIQIVREYDETVPPVLCESGKIQQVFLNILKNGAEAMAEETDKETSPRFILRVKDDRMWVRVEIEDNGPGMEETTRRRIFEPFFTTKSVGKGTGLGLSVSYFIIAENHGGKMDVQVVDGGGTRFIIQLPKTGKS